jgi:hypothetical protein
MSSLLRRLQGQSTGSSPSSSTPVAASSNGIPDSPPVPLRHANDVDVQVTFSNMNKPTKIQRTLGLSVEQLGRVKHLHAMGITDFDYEAQLVVATSVPTPAVGTGAGTNSNITNGSSHSSNHHHHIHSTNTTNRTTRSPPQHFRAIAAVHAATAAAAAVTQQQPPLFGPLSPAQRTSPKRPLRTLSPTASSAAIANTSSLSSLMSSSSSTSITSTNTNNSGNNMGITRGHGPVAAFPLSPTGCRPMASPILSPDLLSLSPVSTMACSSALSTTMSSATTTPNVGPIITPSSSPTPGDDSRSPSYSPSHSPRSRCLPDAPLLRPYNGTPGHGDPPGFLPLLSANEPLLHSNGSTFQLPPPASTFSLYDSDVAPSTISTTSGATSSVSTSSGNSSPRHHHYGGNLGLTISSPGGSYAHLPIMAVPPLTVSTSAPLSLPALSINPPPFSLHSSWPQHTNSSPLTSPAPSSSSNVPAHLMSGSPSRNSNRNSMTGSLPNLGPLLPPLDRLSTRSPDVTSRQSSSTTPHGNLSSPQRSRSNTMTGNSGNGSGHGTGNNSGGTSPNPNRLSVGPLSPINVLSAHNSTSPRDGALISPTTTAAMVANNTAALQAAVIAAEKSSGSSTRTPRRLSPLTAGGSRLISSASFVSLPPVHGSTSSAAASMNGPTTPSATTHPNSNGHHGVASNLSSPVGSHGSTNSSANARGESILTSVGSATDEDFFDDDTIRSNMALNTNGIGNTTPMTPMPMNGHGMGPISPMGGLVPAGSFDDMDSNGSNSAAPLSGGSGHGTPSAISHSYGGPTSALHGSSRNNSVTIPSNRRHTRSSSFVLAAPPVIIGQGAHPGLPLSRSAAHRRSDIAATSPLPLTHRSSGISTPIAADYTPTSAALAAAMLLDTTNINGGNNVSSVSMPVPIPAPTPIRSSSLSRGLAERAAALSINSNVNDRQPSHGHLGYHNSSGTTSNYHNSSSNLHGHKRHPSNGVLPPLIGMARSPSMTTVSTISNGRMSPSSATSPLMNSLAAHMPPHATADT